MFTPYSMNSLFSEFFKEFSGVILGVCETIWGLFGGQFGSVLGGFRRKNYSKNKKKCKNPIFYYLKTTSNQFIYRVGCRLFNYQGVARDDFSQTSLQTCSCPVPYPYQVERRHRPVPDDMQGLLTSALDPKKDYTLVAQQTISLVAEQYVSQGFH